MVPMSFNADEVYVLHTAVIRELDYVEKRLKESYTLNHRKNKAWRDTILKYQQDLDKIHMRIHKERTVNSKSFGDEVNQA